MGYSRVTWGMSAAVWLIVILIVCASWGWPAIAVALIFGILPDIALVAAFGETSGKLKPERVGFYNLLHSMYLPIPILLIGIVIFFVTGGYESGFWGIALAGLAWFVHLAAERALGYGFRDTDGSRIPVK